MLRYTEMTNEMRNVYYSKILGVGKKANQEPKTDKRRDENTAIWKLLLRSI